MTDQKKTLKDYGVKDGDMVMMDRIRRQQRPAPAPGSGGGGFNFDFSQIQIPSNLRGGSSGGAGPSQPRPQPQVRNEDDPAWIREMLSANPDQLAQLKQNNPPLAEAYASGSLEEFAKVLKKQQEARKERDALRIRMMNADPFDLEAQKMIQQEIEQKNIDHNMELAMEASPESFGSVIMLYINCNVNGHPIKAFVDSGAQATIMSQKAAERCNIMRLVDRRWAGIAKGVGTQKIIGRVHMAQIQVENDYLTSSFSILEEQPMDMLLGLDMLKRHQCTIDLKDNVLVIGSTGTKTRFLPEADLPECARLNTRGKDGGPEDMDEAMKASASEHEDNLLKEAIRKSEEETKRLKSDHPQPETGASAAKDLNVILPSDKFSEQDVKTLMAYSFPRDKCIEELRAKDGDVKAATAALFAKSLKF